MLTTEKSIPRRSAGRTRRLPALTPGQIAFCGISFFLLLLLLRNPDVAIVYVTQGLRLCAATVIPSLFPFMVVSELLVMSGAGAAAGRLLSPIVGRPLRLSAPGCCAAFLGAVCGFPIGARVACAYYDRGMITREELTHLLTFCNNPSSAFLLTAVGVSLCGSRRFGILLYASVLLSALVCALVFRPRGRVKIAENTLPRPTSPGLEALPAALTASVTGILQVCGFVVFFAAVTGTLGTVLTRVGASDTLSVFLTGLLEMTSGVSLASAPGGLTTVALIGFFCGWSGLSVHMQILSICGGRGLSFRTYFLAKLLQGGLAALFCVCGVRWLFPDILGTAKDVLALGGHSVSYGRIAVVSGNLFWLFSVLALLITKCAKQAKNGIFIKKMP